MGNTAQTMPIMSSVPEPNSVRVVNTDGRVLIYSVGQVVTVADVLQSHPHHGLTEAGQERKFSTGQVMLHNEEILTPGSTYVILPLPRLTKMVKYKRRLPISDCWFCIGTGGFPISESFSEHSNDDDRHGFRDVEPSASPITMKTSLRQINYSSPMKSRSRSPSPPSLDLQKFLNSAGIQWKQLTDGLSRTWTPDLESIKEESMKLLPPRQSLAELIESETFLAMLQRRSEEIEARG